VHDGNVKPQWGAREKDKEPMG